ncbi:uncharacterized protein LAESUDRAFT_758113 [Laetiporus sulphureus 93-53]|uniref:Uncharacterized protein n=1 Tax=Laetiporus sulphureus 93-53 TaxID=1314785 RepID=A0A165EYJ7_9APHY|nr:uncharacterized protein LAESUDRAFT_758113 [Laetiporus sulphureus 93-53]KZT07986.1 hypothetical protein LAESUDRAFT_758113 [Laetiporus sulphureus 93-53]
MAKPLLINTEATDVNPELPQIRLEEFVIKPLLNENPAVLDNVRLSIRIVANDILIGQTKAVEKELGEARLWRFSDSIDVPSGVPSFLLQVFRENGQLAAERMSSISHNVVHICTRLTEETTSDPVTSYDITDVLGELPSYQVDFIASTSGSFRHSTLVRAF